MNCVLGQRADVVFCSSHLRTKAKTIALASCFKNRTANPDKNARGDQLCFIPRGFLFATSSLKRSSSALTSGHLPLKPSHHRQEGRNLMSYGWGGVRVERSAPQCVCSPGKLRLAPSHELTVPPSLPLPPKNVVTPPHPTLLRHHCHMWFGLAAHSLPHLPGQRTHHRPTARPTALLSHGQVQVCGIQRFGTCPSVSTGRSRATAALS